ncbi:MAG: hypothetical protein IH994_00395 [Proteobacteria bacterium]|nr:hypothetical protein [Pseudomonadota bacterium]
MASMHDHDLNTSSRTAPVNALGGVRLFGAALIVGALLLTLKYYPGLENEPAYAGNVYQILNPSAFAGDSYGAAETSIFQKPLQLSLMYGLVKAVGNIWLDERFLVFIYLGLVIAGLLGIDRTARLLGITGPVERLILLLVFLKDHALLDHKVLLAHHADVNHMAFAIPIIIWLFYVVLARKGLWVVLLLSALLSLVSLRNAFFPIVMSLIVAAVGGGTRDRIIIGALFAVGAAVAFWGLFYAFPIDEGARLVIWEYIRAQEQGDANPFIANAEPAVFAMRVLTWMGILAAALFLSPGEDPAYRGVRIIMALGLLVWLVGGLYITYAPDVLKQPLLIGFAPNRALAWPQNLAYVALFALAFRGTRENSSSGFKVLVTVAGLAVLFVIGPGNLEKWSVLLLAAGLASVMVHIFLHRLDGSGGFSGQPLARVVAKNWRTIFAGALGLTLAVTFSISLFNKLPYWAFTVRTGVFGGTAAATWVDVADYVRNETPPGASVLPFMAVTDRGRILPKATRTLATRGGRAMPIPEVYGPGFRDPGSWEMMFEQLGRLKKIEARLADLDFMAADSLMEGLVPVPDYVILPLAVVGSTSGFSPSYALEKTVGDYAIFHRRR